MPRLCLAAGHVAIEGEQIELGLVVAWDGPSIAVNRRIESQVTRAKQIVSVHPRITSALVPP
jgi:hypothetical protein